MTNREAFGKLKEISTHLEGVEYDKIIELFQIIGKIPIPIGRMPPGTQIDRARKNIGDNLFTNVDQLTYIKDKKVIDDYLIEFGRANKPHQPLFYGAVESTLIKHQRIVALAETSELFQDPEGINFDGELYTISRWQNTTELFLAEMVFSSEAIQTNPDTKRAFEKQTAFLKEAAGDGDIEFYTEFIVFISDQFARLKKTHHDYKISTAYADYIMGRGQLHGVAFPSVQTQYHGQNIVLPPEVVDQYLTVQVLATQRLFKNKMKTVITNHKNCENPTECADNIIWTDIAPEHLSTTEHILAQLNS